MQGPKGVMLLCSSRDLSAEDNSAGSGSWHVALGIKIAQGHSSYVLLIPLLLWTPYLLSEDKKHLFIREDNVYWSIFKTYA